MVDPKGRHGLSCNLQAGRKSRHDNINNLVKRALVQAKIPSTNEPIGLSRSDGKRPDGLTLTTWKKGKCLIWDYTCADTLCKTYVNMSSKNPAAAAMFINKNLTNMHLNFSQHIENVHDIQM